MPTFEELEQVKSTARRMPMHIPGRVITLKLDDLPLYMDLNGLKPDGMSATGVLLLKRNEDE
jgi:hypothetical protein